LKQEQKERGDILIDVIWAKQLPQNNQMLSIRKDDGYDCLVSQEGLVCIGLEEGSEVMETFFASFKAFV